MNGNIASLSLSLSRRSSARVDAPPTPPSRARVATDASHASPSPPTPRDDDPPMSCREASVAGTPTNVVLQKSIVTARRTADTMFHMTLKSALMAIVLFLCLLAGQFSVARAGALEDGLAYLQVRWIAMIAS
jgi:hypothetical protein